MISACILGQKKKLELEFGQAVQDLKIILNQNMNDSKPIDEENPESRISNETYLYLKLCKTAEILLETNSQVNYLKVRIIE